MTALVDAAAWKVVRLGDVVTLQRGFDLPNSERLAGTVPVVSSSGVTGTHSLAKVNAPAVVTGRYGTLGEVFYLTEACCPLTTTLFVRDFHGNDPRFCHYFLQAQNLGVHDGGAAVPGINRNVVHELPVRVPPLATQRKIAAILSAYDDLIENNSRRIRILEEMAERIYHEWFLNFRYPGYEGVPLVDSELGSIPVGWRVSPLRVLCEYVADGDWIESKDQGGDDYRLLQVANIGVGCFRETGTYRFIGAETFDRLRCTEVCVGDVLVSRMPDPVGRAWFVDRLGERAITAVDVAIARPRAVSGRFLAFTLNSATLLRYAAQRASGTTRARITRKDLERFPVLVADPSVQARFTEVLERLGELTTTMRVQTVRLTAGRDLLVPRLISGAVDVEDLDIPTGEAAS
jgi:type I restriction enzyme S subunit